MQKLSITSPTSGGSLGRYCSLADSDNGVLVFLVFKDRLCGLVVRVLCYRSGGPSSIVGITRKKVSGSGTGSTHPRE
jgi:hypothetical protein